MTALLALVLLLSSAPAFAGRAAFAEASAPRPEFFVFDNGVGRGSWTPEQQAQTLKELGYDGISYNYTTPEDLARWQKAFAAVGLKIYGLYLYTYIDRPEAFDPRLPEAVAMLKGTPTTLWITVQKPKSASADDEAKAVAVVQRVADLAKRTACRSRSTAMPASTWSTRWTRHAWSARRSARISAPPSTCVTST